MKMTDALLGEHGAFNALFDHVEALASGAENVAQIQTTTVALRAMLASHCALEESILFPALAPHLADGGPLEVLCAEHDEMEQALEQLEDTDDVRRATVWVAHALDLAREHFRKEEEVLFKVAERALDDATLERLGRHWAEARGVTIA